MATGRTNLPVPHYEKASKKESLLPDDARSTLALPKYLVLIRLQASLTKTRRDNSSTLTVVTEVAIDIWPATANSPSHAAWKYRMLIIVAAARA